MTVLRKPSTRPVPTVTEYEQLKEFAINNRIDFSKIGKKINEFGDLLEVDTIDVKIEDFVKNTLGMS